VPLDPDRLLTLIRHHHPRINQGIHHWQAGQLFYARAHFCVPPEMPVGKRSAVVAFRGFPYGWRPGSARFFRSADRAQVVASGPAASGLYFGDIVMSRIDAETPRLAKIGIGTAIVCCMLLVGGCSGDSVDDDANVSDPVPQTSADDPATINTATEEPAETEPPTTPGEEPVEPLAETGTLAGVVSFEGELPPPRVIQATKDPEICMKGEGEVQDVHVKNGKLAGAVVELSVRGARGGMKPPKDGFVIRQKDCRFTNPTIVAYDGAELTIYNDDPIQHNVNSGQWNQIQGPGPDPIKQKINFSGVPFLRVTCNIHNWMETWVYVAQSKFHAVSGEDGSFRIKGIPSGKYRGYVIHPTLGKQRLSVTIEAGQTLEESFVFKAP